MRLEGPWWVENEMDEHAVKLEIVDDGTAAAVTVEGTECRTLPLVSDEIQSMRFDRHTAPMDGGR